MRRNRLIIGGEHPSASGPGIHPTASPLLGCHSRHGLLYKAHPLAAERAWVSGAARVIAAVRGALFSFFLAPCAGASMGKGGASAEAASASGSWAAHVVKPAEKLEARDDFFWDTSDEPHASRRKAILRCT